MYQRLESMKNNDQTLINEMLSKQTVAERTPPENGS
jgi:hypothetical protein